MISYPELLTELKSQPVDNHLLLGNGFNNSLCISTSYKDIYNRMTEEYAPYKKIENAMEEENYDIEKFIDRYKKQIVGNDKEFLDEFIENKIKKDFMKSLSDLVMDKIKNLYQDETRNIYLFFKNFMNYFTLNYDPFLYLIFMKFIRHQENQGMAIHEHRQIFPSDAIKRMNNIREFIEKNYSKGKFRVFIEGEIESGSPLDLNKISKTFFIEAVKKSYSDVIKRENWSNKEIEMAVNRIYNNKSQDEEILTVNDGFIKHGNSVIHRIPHSEFLIFDENENIGGQNLFFLHGGFHLIEKNGRVEKITQTQSAAFHRKIHEVIQADEEEIICVLTGRSEDKIDRIEKNSYLNYGFQRLDEISGNIVILGCSFSENDAHIFKKFNSRNIKNIFVATSIDNEVRTKEIVENMLPDKRIIYFDYETINGFSIDTS